MSASTMKPMERTDSRVLRLAHYPWKSPAGGAAKMSHMTSAMTEAPPARSTELETPEARQLALETGPTV